MCAVSQSDHSWASRSLQAEDCGLDENSALLSDRTFLVNAVRVLKAAALLDGPSTDRYTRIHTCVPLTASEPRPALLDQRWKSGRLRAQTRNTSCAFVVRGPPVQTRAPHLHSVSCATGRVQCCPADLLVLRLLTTFRVLEQLHHSMPTLVQKVVDADDSGGGAADSSG